MLFISTYKHINSCVGSDPAVEVSHSWQAQTRATGFLSRERSGVRDNREVVGWRVLFSGQGTKVLSWSQMEGSPKKMSNFVRKNGKKRLFKK